MVSAGLLAVPAERLDDHQSARPVRRPWFADERDRRHALRRGWAEIAQRFPKPRLPNGRKLGTNDTKKVLGSGIAGQPVKLFEATDELVITEGIEKGLALHLATHKPAWAMLGAGNFEQLVIPDTVTKLWIYGDNDADGDFTGQYFAFSLARRARREQK